MALAHAKLRLILPSLALSSIPVSPYRPAPTLRTSILNWPHSNWAFAETRRMSIWTKSGFSPNFAVYSIPASCHWHILRLEGILRLNEHKALAVSDALKSYLGSQRILYFTCILSAAHHEVHGLSRWSEPRRFAARRPRKRLAFQHPSPESGVRGDLSSTGSSPSEDPWLESGIHNVVAVLRSRGILLGC